jgi:thioredoxin reductase (NADPH)
MVYDIVVVGSGPAGLTAAIYARRAKKSVLVIEKESMGGNITHSPKVENYPGYESISGLDLADKFVAQAMALEVEFEFDEVTSITKTDVFNVTCKRREIEARSVILATGSKHRTLGLKGEEKLVGKGISYCAVCDGAFYQGQDVTVIGGGNSALQEAILLSKTSKSVTLIQNLGFLTGEASLIEQVNKTENIRAVFNKVVIRLNGEESLESIVLRDEVTQEELIYETKSIFVAIGQVADNEPFENLVDLDEYGFIVSDEKCLTKTEGLFVAGDCKKKFIRQIVTATGDGSIAALGAIRYLDK